MTKNLNIKALNELGQSIWYDNLSKDVLSSGELARYIEQGVSGLTSNPTIFDKAISGSSLYDKEIAALAKKKLSISQICEELMISDVASAADLLLPVYRASKGSDGYASIEVSPLLARDTKSTIEEALRLWSKLSRPNIMIKIPATEEGLPCIRKLLSEGINVNVTLIFSGAFYLKVADAYLSGLEDRIKTGGAIDNISSVASFFVSRVDSICEKLFDKALESGKVNLNSRSLIEGKVGIANSKLAYSHYEKIFKSDRFKTLAAKGARVQRPLWASTGTKNAKFSPVLYVEELAGRDTVNTVPPQTLTSLLKQASIEPRLHMGLVEAQSLISGLSGMGIDFDRALLELQNQGVDLFSQSYKALLESVQKKSAQLA